MNVGHEIAKYEADITHHISELVKIRSVEDAPEPGKPFGSGVNRALEYMLALADSMGFRTENIDGYAGHAEYGSGDRLTAVLVHLDTVHEGKGWTYPPFGGVIEDGRIIGRGASDNKGPAVVALFCLKAIRDLELPVRSRIRIIFGTNEESGMKDMDYYFAKQPLPDWAFVPDAGYPLFNVEMGSAIVTLSRPLDPIAREDQLQIVGMNGGVPVLPTPEFCEAGLKADGVPGINWNELLNSGTNVKITQTDGALAEFAADGKASTPPTNAIADMIEWIAGLPYITNADPMVAFLREKLGRETNGKSLGIDRFDEESGATIVFLKQIYTENDTINAVLNVRYPVTHDGDSLLDHVAKQAEPYGLSMRLNRHLRPVYVPPDHPVIRILSGVYERMTGNKAELLRMGAGTYARKLKNRGVAFGAGLQGGVDTNVHRPDEYVRIEDMMKHAEICLQGLYELALENAGT